MGKVADRVKETSTTTGTGNFTVSGAATGYRTFSSVFPVGVKFYYCIALGAEWEVGEGYMSDSTTLVRDDIEASSNSNALVNFSAGTKDVFCTFPAYEFTTRGLSQAIARGWALP